MKEIKFADQLDEISPDRLITQENDDKIAKFFLVLGVFYNDLKSSTKEDIIAWVKLLVAQDTSKFKELDAKLKSFEEGYLSSYNLAKNNQFSNNPHVSDLSAETIKSSCHKERNPQHINRVQDKSTILLKLTHLQVH